MINKTNNIKRGRLGFNGLFIIVRNELKALKTNKQIIMSSVLSPVLYFAFYSVGIQSTFGDIAYKGTSMSFMTYSLIGILAMSMFKEMYQCVYRMIIDKKWGLLSLKILNGINPSLYILGISTFPIVGILIQAIVLYLFSLILGGALPLGNFILILLFIVIAILFWTSLLLCIAMSINNYRTRDFIMDVVLLPVIFSAPLFYSLDEAPFIISFLSKLNPLTYQVNALRDIAIGNYDLNSILILILSSVVLYIVAILVMRNIDFRNDEH